MRKFLIILIVIINHQSLTRADDIRDFEIEGLSIGESLIQHMTINEIISNDHGHYPEDSKFYEVAYSGNFNQYEYVNIGLKRNDDNFKIYFIRGMNVVENKKNCLKIKETIAQDLKELFPKFYFLEGSQKHYYYKNSTQYISQFSVTSNANKSDHARVECMIIDNKDKKIHGELMSTLEVIIASKEFNIWLDSL
ncbi:hypothetical protein N9U24_01360 [Candidatus Pelagibacter sp.]|nr:hypothetical protein [Candidatus Pelagibacter sp.]